MRREITRPGERRAGRKVAQWQIPGDWFGSMSATRPSAEVGFNTCGLSLTGHSVPHNPNDLPRQDWRGFLVELLLSRLAASGRDDVRYPAAGGIRRCCGPAAASPGSGATPS